MALMSAWRATKVTKNRGKSRRDEVMKHWQHKQRKKDIVPGRIAIHLRKFESVIAGATFISPLCFTLHQKKKNSKEIKTKTKTNFQ